MMQKLKRIVLDNDTFAGRAFDFGVQLLIVVSLITYSIETLPDLAEGTRKLLFGIECGTVFAFTIEYLLRIYFTQPRPKFMLSFFGLIDLAAILPFYLATGADRRSQV